MPSDAGGHAVVKLVTVGGEPRIQGVCVVFDAATLAPVALVDGIALTNVRTPAVSALAVRRARRARRAPPARLRPRPAGPRRTSRRSAPCARSSTSTWSAATAPACDELVAAADIVCCATTAREPLFDGALVADHATVVAIGSHEPDARETDDALAGRATVVVESRASALREAGDVIGAIAPGALRGGALVTLADWCAGAAVGCRPARGCSRAPGWRGRTRWWRRRSSADARLLRPRRAASRRVAPRVSSC